MVGDLTHAITIQQPWAWAVVHGGKHIENRGSAAPWASNTGRRVWIHAGARWSKRGEYDERVNEAYRLVANFAPPFAVCVGPPDRVAGHLAHPSLRHPLARGRIVFGAVIGSAVIADVHPASIETHNWPTTACCPPWGEVSYVDAWGETETDVFHIVLEDVEPADADGVPCPGRLGLWKVPPEVLGCL